MCCNSNNKTKKNKISAGFNNTGTTNHFTYERTYTGVETYSMRIKNEPSALMNILRG